LRRLIARGHGKRDRYDRKQTPDHVIAPAR
jgi:hypothetical protein